MNFKNKGYLDFYFSWSILNNWIIGIEIVPRSYCLGIHFYLVKLFVSFEWYWGKQV